MAVHEVIEMLPGAVGSWSLQNGHALQVKLKIKTDRTDGPMTVLGAAGVKIGDTYRYPLTRTAVESNPAIFVQSVSADQGVPLAGGWVQWTVTVSYGRLDPSQDRGGPVDENGERSPFLAPPRLTWRHLVEDEPVILDRDGEWIVNAAGDPFDPPLSMPRQTVVAVVTRVEREFDPAWILDYMGRINKTSWLGFDAGSVLCQSITSDRAYNDDVKGVVWNTEYQFAFKKSIIANSKIIRRGWAARLLNSGLRQLVDDKKIACVTDDGMPVSQPVMLKTSGVQADPTDKPNYLTFDYLPEAEFADLNMPADLFSAGTPVTP